MAEQMEAPSPTEPATQEGAVGDLKSSRAVDQAVQSEAGPQRAVAEESRGPQTEAPGAVAVAAATSADHDAPGLTRSDDSIEGPAPDAPASEEGAQADETAAEAAEGDGGEKKGKRKRRRKRKRKPGEGEAAEAGEERRKEASNAPFAHFFSGGASAKRHAFAANEVVAGRVVAVDHGVIQVDLFGKASAVADEFEPREVPPAPEPEPEKANAEPSPATTDEAVPLESEAPAEPADEAPAEPADVAATETEVSEPDTQQGGPDAAPAVQPAPTVSVGEQSAAPAPGDLQAVSAEPLPEDVPKTEPEPADDEIGRDDEGREDEPKGPLAAAPVVPETFPRPEPPLVGSILKGRVGSVSESGHIVLVNRNINKAEVRAVIARYREERRRVQGLVYGFNRGGFDVLVQGIRAFCPASAMSLQEIKDPQEFLGKKLEFLLPASKGGKDIVVSRRSILERQARKKAKELLRSLEPGQTLTGTVTSVRDFGLFVDIGGVEGLVHQSELSHGFGVKPVDVASVGDEVQVQVLRVGADPARKPEKKERVTRVSLSMKALQADPWESEPEAVAEGAVREGKVTRTTDFGAFVELAPHIEGLLHISELGRDLQHARQAVDEGDTVLVVVERADRKTRRISLSRLTDAEAEDFRAGKLSTSGPPKNLRPGARIQVTVERADHRGVQVRVAGVIGRRSRGFVPASETGTDRGSDLRKAFPNGEVVEVKVIGTDRDGGLKCSVKALAIDDERRAVKDYRREASKQGFGTFGDLLRAKLGQPPNE